MSAPGWAPAIEAQAVTARTARRLTRCLVALHQEALALCRLLESWARGEAEPPTPSSRIEALREAAGRVDGALDKLERPLRRFLLELEPEQAEGRSWFGEPSAAELIDWEPVLVRAGVDVPPHLVAAAYLELAVLIRALEGLTASVEVGAVLEPGALWAGLFDLRENLFDRAQDEVRALAGSSGAAWPST
jgi:hypothetical protein